MKSSILTLLKNGILKKIFKGLLVKIFRLFTLILISLIPGQFIRRSLYSVFLGFKMAPTSRIDMFNFVDIKSLKMADHSHIRGFGNVFLSVDAVSMQEYSRIGGPRIGINLFRGTSNKDKGDYPVACLTLRKCSIVELFNYFDLCADITIGNNVVVGGIRSVFFTHTLFEKHFMPITIGDDVYIGSNCRFQMGTSIAPKSVVGMGAVVIKGIEEEDCLIAGVPAKVMRKGYGYSAKNTYTLRKKVYYSNGEYIHPA